MDSIFPKYDYALHVSVLSTLSSYGNSPPVVTVHFCVLGCAGAEVKSRTSAAAAALARLSVVWKDRNISLKSKIRLLRAVVISVFLYACQTWSITAEISRKIAAFEMKCYRTLLCVRYTEHRTNISVREEIDRVAGTQKPLLDIVRMKKLQLFGHIVRSDHLSKIVLHGCVEGARARGRPRMLWLDNVMNWTGLSLSSLLSVASDRYVWHSFVLRCSSAPQRP